MQLPQSRSCQLDQEERDEGLKEKLLEDGTAKMSLNESSAPTVPKVPPQAPQIPQLENQHTDPDKEEPEEKSQPVEVPKKPLDPLHDLPEMKMPSPTVADPSFDPAKEFLSMLLNPATPVQRKKQLMIE